MLTRKRIIPLYLGLLLAALVAIGVTVYREYSRRSDIAVECRQIAATVPHMSWSLEHLILTLGPPEAWVPPSAGLLEIAMASDWAIPGDDPLDGSAWCSLSPRDARDRFE